MEKIFAFTIGLYLMLAVFVGSAFAGEKVAEASGKMIFRSDKRQIRDYDVRLRKLGVFLKKYNSPLLPQAGNFVAMADRYSLDWRLVVAISGVESGFGKRIPKGSYNAWGFGIPTGKTEGIKFKNWEAGIETVSKALREKYLDRGAKTLFEIARVYAPFSKTWAAKVAYFMREIEETSPSFALSL